MHQTKAYNKTKMRTEIFYLLIHGNYESVQGGKKWKRKQL